jgi:hypothetical protein
MLRPAFRGQPVYTAKIMSDFFKLTTTVTTGVIATVVTLRTNLITNFGARFPGFEEFRIVKARIIITMFSSTNPGRVVLYADPDDSTTPTLQLARNHRSMMLGASDITHPFIMSYTPHDLEKLNYVSMGAADNAIGYFKIYTDNAALGASIVATDYLDYSVDLTVQFRGFQG